MSKSRQFSPKSLWGKGLRAKIGVDVGGPDLYTMVMKKRILLTLLLLSLSGCRTFISHNSPYRLWEWESLGYMGLDYKEKREVVAFHDKFHEVVKILDKSD